MIYFDNAATSYIKPKAVKLAVNMALNTLTANPGRSGHTASQKIGEVVFETREAVKEFFHAPNYDVVFTLNCTGALNLAIMGSLKAGDHVITSCYEHNSVLRPLEHLKSNSVEVSVLDCRLDAFDKALEAAIKPNTKLVVVTAMSNVTGEQPNLYEVGKICKAHNILLLVDGAQATGHKAIDLEKLGIDMYAFAGHKGFGAITGVGGLVVKNGVELQPILFGGTGTESFSLVQPNTIPEGLEAGTISTIAIVSLNAGVKFMSANFDRILKQEDALSSYLFEQLSKLKGLTLYSSPQSKNVFSFNIDGVDSSTVANILNDEFNICVRSGLHCAPLIHKRLNTLETGAVRASIDYNNTKQEINYFISALKQIAARYSSL